MTVESLLSEIKSTGQLHKIQHWRKHKQAEEAYFGGHWLHHDASTSHKQHNFTGPISHAIAVTREKVAHALKHAPHVGGGRKSKTPRSSESRESYVSAEEVAKLKEENKEIKEELAGLKKIVEELNKKFAALSTAPKHPEAATEAVAAEDDDDDDFELFGSSDEEDNAEKERIKEERLKAYAEKKAKKPGVIAKSSVILDVKPWDDETDLGEMEKMVRSIGMEGLVWGGSKLIPLAYGIKKLQIISVVEDEKVSVEDLQEKIQEFEDYVQSVDIAAFNKI